MHGFDLFLKECSVIKYHLYRVKTELIWSTWISCYELWTHWCLSAGFYCSCFEALILLSAWPLR